MYKIYMKHRGENFYSLVINGRWVDAVRYCRKHNIKPKYFFPMYLEE